MGDEYGVKFIKAFAALVITVLFFKLVVFGLWMQSDVHKGDGYSFTPPRDWKEVKESSGVRAVFETLGRPDIVTFVTPERTGYTDVPLASMSILTAKLANPTWMEDEFPNLLTALREAGYPVIDRGQIKIDTMDFHWVFFEDPQAQTVNMEFYSVNDVNKLYKIQYTADLDAFKEYRPAFEAAKDTIKMSQQFW